MNLDEKGRKLYRVLKNLKINVKTIKIKESEYFDTYDIELVEGVRFSKLEKALPDIGLFLKAKSMPNGYPVMEEGIYRIEVQKKELKSKNIKDLLSVQRKGYCPFSVGVDNYGVPLGIDLHNLPNLLIGGMPGAGKSMFLHSIALSLIKNDAKMFLVDPKMVEFGMYEKQAESIVSSVKDTYRVIEIVNSIMESRFIRLKKSGCRDILSYNKKNNRKMKPVVILVDEWADIVLQESKIQKPLCRIAQKGRAAGVSVVLATQRPSASVISGLIKANFSGRVCLRVASKLESRIVLDQAGGESLSDVGMGLYLDHRLSRAKLFRSPYIKDINTELERIIFDKQKGKPKGFFEKWLM